MQNRRLDSPPKLPILLVRLTEITKCVKKSKHEITQENLLSPQWHGIFLTMAKETLRVGFIQYQILENSPRQNSNVLMKQISALSQKKIHLVLLPEICIGGTLQKSERQNYANAYKILVKDLKKSAQKKSLWIYGSVIKKQNNCFYNTALLINPNGNIASRYRKIHLFRHENEHDVFSAGVSPTLTNTPWGKTGLLICYDLRFPELARQLTLKGAKILLVCAQWPKPRREHWLTLARARAIENQIFVIACNRTGKKNGLVYSGDSVVFSPWGERLMHLKKNQLTGICEIDLQRLGEVRKRYPFLKDVCLTPLDF